MYYEMLCEALGEEPTYGNSERDPEGVRIQEADGPVTALKPSAPVVSREPEDSAMTGTEDHVPLGRYGITIERTTFG